ncbi:MAG TPA: M20/M25/M40 family metallo-hydrolase [Thermoanaerobaculia bacterium]|nr:M20/M25/M40 family metallo-hydrolase [Thermoanaerobaculia bacterium]
MFSNVHPLVLFASLLAPLPGLAGPPVSDFPAAAPGLIGGALTSATGEESLRYLTDRVGPRLTGTPEASRAIAWAVEQMRAIGLANVHTEPFTLRRGWMRGTASFSITEPVRRTLRVVAYGWTGSTAPSGVETGIVAANLYRLDEALKTAGEWKGKIVLTVERGEKPGGWSLRAARLEALVRRAIEVRAAGVALMPLAGPAGGLQLPHTTALAYETIDEIPVVSLTPEGHAEIERLLASGGPVRARLAVENRVTPGPIDSANVVGEIPGSGGTPEFVVLGAHLDSWDLAEGATDDAFGVAAVLQAAEAIVALGRRPRRTIRIVLFTGEEQRFLGSLAWVRAHASELPDLVSAFVLDDGAGPIDGIHDGGRAEALEPLRRCAEELAAFGRIAVDDDVEAGTDTLPFTLAGAAGMAIAQDSPEYPRTHHSEADTLDKVDFAVLRRDAAVVAVLAFWAADRPERLARAWPASKTGDLLEARGLADGLRFYGLWPFDLAARSR